jgi:ankyrin repeat protein
MDQDPLAAFIDAACVPLDSGHATGSLERAEAIRAMHPEVATSTIHAAAILGDDATVRRFLELDPRNATAKDGPRDWDALTHLCFSRYLRLDQARSDGFVRAAEALLDAGASANTGWYEMNHQPKPEWESALYGASGIAHHPELTRLLLERGANPNDDETVYHAPEGYDNRALELLVETGQLTGESLSLMLIRKHDWHDYEGVKWLLEHGADPKRDRWRGFRAIHHALARDNDLRIVELLFDHGADPMVVTDGMSAAARAARRGRGDVLESLERRRATDRGVRAQRYCSRALDRCARAGARRRAAGRGRPAVGGVRGRREHERRSSPARPRRAGDGALRGRRILGRRAEQHGAPRRGVARTARDREAAHRARLADRRAGWQGTHAAGAGRPRVRGLVLGRTAFTGVGRRAPPRWGVGARRPVPLRLWRSR